MPSIRLLSFQTRGFPAEVEKNIELIAATIEKHKDDFDLIVTPELFITGYNIGIEESKRCAEQFENSIKVICVNSMSLLMIQVRARYCKAI
jgi:predicted amidohydrolase